jgi:hypothetical protein
MAFDIAGLQQIGSLRAEKRRDGAGSSVAGSGEGVTLVKKNRSADAKNKPKLEKYVPPSLVDYGNVTKITAAPKSVSGPDGIGPKKGSCL